MLSRSWERPRLQVFEYEGAEMSQTRIKIKKQKRKKQPSRIDRGLAYWTVVGALTAYTTIGGDRAMRAYAQDAAAMPATNVSSGQTQGLTVQRFEFLPGHWTACSQVLAKPSPS